MGISEQESRQWHQAAARAVEANRERIRAALGAVADDLDESERRLCARLANSADVEAFVSLMEKVRESWELDEPGGDVVAESGPRTRVELPVGLRQRLRSGVERSAGELLFSLVAELENSPGVIPGSKRFPGEQNVWVYASGDGRVICYRVRKPGLSQVLALWGAVEFREEDGVIPGWTTTREGLRADM